MTVNGTASITKQVREVYYNSLQEGFGERLSAAFKILENLSRSDLVDKLVALLEIVSNSQVEFEELEGLCEVLEKLNNFDGLLAQQRLDKSEEPTNKALPKKMKLYALRAALQQNKSKDVTLYESLRKEALTLLHKMFKRELAHYRTLPLYELWYYEDARTLRGAINAMPRAAVSTALGKPHVYLQDIAKPGNEDSIRADVPDTSILFKLHLESGVMINLYDWMQAFIAVHESSGEKLNNKELCSRFTHSAAELQLLGFIKSTKRKTDHVSRLTWGNL